MPPLLAVLACHGGPDGSDTPGGRVVVGPSLVFDPAVVDLGAIEVPCDQEHTVAIVNSDDHDHRLDAVSLESSADLTLLTVIDQPVVIHPGARFDVVVGVDAGAAYAIEGRLRLASDEGERTAVLRGSVAYHDTAAQTFEVPRPKVDVLWVVDHTGAMATRYEDDLSEGFADFVDALDAAADWRMILVTEDSGCRNGGVLTPTSADPAGTLAAHAFDPGTQTYGHQLLALASRALAENGVGECNEDFERDDAQLLVVPVSDAPETSSLGWAHWVDDYFQYADTVAVAGVIDAGDSCGTGPDGYLDAVQATDGAAVDLCDAGFEHDLDRLTDAVFDAAPTFVLSAPALEDTLEITVDGEPRTGTLDETGTRLTLDAPAPSGAPVTVDWRVPGSCD